MYSTKQPDCHSSAGWNPAVGCFTLYNFLDSPDLDGRMTKTIMKTSMIYLVTIFLSVCFVYSLIEPFLLENKYYTVTNKKIPAYFDNKKIVFISDIHHGPYFSQNRVRKLVEKVNALNPDIIVLGGDCVSANAKYIKTVFEELKNLHATIGVYGILGNHDNYEDGKLTIQSMQKDGFHILDNASEWIENNGERIKIGGVGDMWTENQNINPTIDDTKSGDYTILVSHNPDYAEHMPVNKIDLMLSGHTHGGQITLFGLYAPYTASKYGQKYREGIIKKGDTEIIVSHGVGTVVLPMRFFARPDIVVITLKKG